MRRTDLRNLLGRFWWPQSRPALAAFLIALPATAWILHAAEADKSANGPATYDAAEKESIFAQLKSATSKPIDALAAGELAERIDELLAASWRKNHIVPAAATTDAEFVRRIYLDLIGRIPSVQESLTFFDNPRPDKRRQLVDELLRARRLGGALRQHLARFAIGRFGKP